MKTISEIKTINSRQLAYLLNIDEAAALLKIFKTMSKSKSDKIMEEFYSSEKGKKKLPVVSAEIADVELSSGINIYALIKNMNENFIRDKACMDYIFKHAESKLKPSKSNGNYPRAIRLPVFLYDLLTYDNIKIIQEKIAERFAEIIAIVKDKHGYTIQIN